MRCPYCVSEIHDDASVCPVCRRDVRLLTAAQAKIRDLEARIARQDELLRRCNMLPADNLAPDGMAPPPVEGDAVAPASTSTWLAFCLLPLALLLVAHGLIVVVFDLNTLYLRVVSLLLPLPFSLLLTARAKQPLWQLAAMAIVLSLLAVFGMSVLTAMVDGTPVLPDGAREWREFLEYAVSIGLSYTSGAIVGWALWVRQNDRRKLDRMHGLLLKISTWLSNGQTSMDKLQTAASNVKEIGALLTATGTTVASAYMGLKGVLGG